MGGLQPVKVMLGDSVMYNYLPGGYAKHTQKFDTQLNQNPGGEAK